MTSQYQHAVSKIHNIYCMSSIVYVPHLHRLLQTSLTFSIY